MPLFICAKCGCIENTALSTYWSRNSLPYSEDLKEYQGKALCSECGTFDSQQGKIVPGRWHGRFPKEQATDDYKRRVGSDGLIH